MPCGSNQDSNKLYAIGYRTMVYSYDINLSRASGVGLLSPVMLFEYHLIAFVIMCDEMIYQL